MPLRKCPILCRETCLVNFWFRWVSFLSYDRLNIIDLQALSTQRNERGDSRIRPKSSRGKKRRRRRRIDCREKKKKKKTLPDDSGCLMRIHNTRLRKISNNGPQSFSSSALCSLYIHPRTDYHTDLRMSLPRVNYILLRRTDCSVAYISCTTIPSSPIRFETFYPTRVVCYLFEF